MASLPYSHRPLPLADRWGPERWPATVTRRLLLRLALCLPYLALAGWAGTSGAVSDQNAALARAARSMGSGLRFMAYPSPVPLLVARLLPDAAVSLAMVGALCAGGVLHICWERLVRAQVPSWLIAMLLVGLGASPALWLTAAGNVAGMMGLAFFSVAMAGTLDFVFSSRTSSGYAAGVSLALAVLCDPIAVAYAAALLAATPFLFWRRFRHEPYLVRSTLAVLAFPTVAVLGFWAFLGWRFSAGAWHPLALIAPFPGVLHPPFGGALAAGRSASLLGRQLLCSPIFAVSALMALRRRLVNAVAFLFMPVFLLLASLVGIHAPAVQGVVALDVLGLLAVPTRPRRSAAALYAATVPVGIILPLTILGAPSLTALIHGVGA